MKHLKLVVNNQKENRELFFNKKELKTILNLYARMVSNGEWKDYGLNILKKEVIFYVYKRTADFPIYKIYKNFKPKYKNEKYFVKDSQENILEKSENLENLLGKVQWKRLKLVN